MLYSHRANSRSPRIATVINYRADSGDIYLKVLYLSLQLVDLGLTIMAAQLGYPELNPFMKSALSSPLSLLVIKAFIPFMIAWIVPGKYLIPAIALLCAILAWNLQQLLQLL